MVLLLPNCVVLNVPQTNLTCRLGQANQSAKPKKERQYFGKLIFGLLPVNIGVKAFKAGCLNGLA
jgi:hypothetical protein